MPHTDEESLQVPEMLRERNSMPDMDSESSDTSSHAGKMKKAVSLLKQAIALLSNPVETTEEKSEESY